MMSKKKSDSKRNGSKVDPSFKSKRYRDKLRAEVKELENLLPVDRPALHRKLDSQAVYRLAISFLRIKATVNTTDGDPKEVPWRPGDIQGTSQRQNSSIIQAINSAEDPMDRQTLSKILDGFVLVATTDGTIMYVTEGAQLYTGYTQTDLLHRCMYGLVHPEDYSVVRGMLEEQTLYRMPNTSEAAIHNREAKRLEFFCRLKCFHGNSSGYLQFFCSGITKVSQHLPATLKMTNNVVILYCQPFLLNGPDNTEGRAIFWTKHDLDLTLNDLEEGLCDILGYSPSELCGSSFYQFTHPEDLNFLVQSHLAMTETSDIHSVFVRLIKKTGCTMWVQSKGKVISKNGKKFCIVFTHSLFPEEDNAFLKQEESQRRWQCWGQTGFSTNHVMDGAFEYSQGHSTRGHDFSRDSGSIHMNRYGHCNGLKNIQTPTTVLGSVFSPVSLTDHGQYLCEPCPSSWHRNQDRHSPLIPSTHLNFRIPARERQNGWLQCSSRKRRHLNQDQSQTCDVTQQSSHDHTVNSSNSCVKSGLHEPNHDSIENFFRNSGTMVEVSPCPYSGYTTVGTSRSNFPFKSEYPYLKLPCLRTSFYQNIQPHVQQFPYAAYPFTEHLNGRHFQATDQYIASQQPPYHNSKPDSMPVVSDVENYNLPHNHSHIRCSQNYNDYFCFQNPGKYEHRSPDMRRSPSADLQFSMVCNGSIGVSKDEESAVNYLLNGSLRKSVEYEHKVKSEATDASACLVKANRSDQTREACPSSRVKYDFKASIHMRIVESEVSNCPEKKLCSGMPEFGSFIN